MIRSVPDPTRAPRLALILLAMAALGRPGTASAQPPGVESFVRTPTTPLEFWEIADYLVRTGQAAQAVPFLQKFEAANPDAPTLVRLLDQYGNASIMRMIDHPSTRPFADRLIPKAAAARRAFVSDPARIASAIAALPKSPEERRFGFDRLVEAGPAAVPPMLKAIDDPANTPEAREATSTVLSSLGPMAVPPLLAALDGPEAAPTAARALGRIGDARAVPRLTATAATEGPARDDARRAIARITGRPFDAQPRPPIRVVADGAWRAHRAVAAEPSSPATGWRWDPATKSVVPMATTAAIVESDAGLILARAAVALDPADADARAALLSLALDRDPNYPATPRPPADAATVAVIGDVVRKATADGRPTLALRAVRALAKVANRESFRDLSRPNVLVDALNSPYRRVQFAAAEALVNIGPSRAFRGSSLVVPVLSRFIAPSPIPRAIVIDGNAARGSQSAGFLRMIGYDVRLALLGDEGFRLASEMADVELIAIDPDLVQGPWRLHDTLANLRADARTADIPIFLVGPLNYQDKFASKLEGFPDVKFLVTPTETALFKAEVDRGLASLKARPLSAQERGDYAAKAAGLLARVATKPGNPFERDLIVAAPTLSSALNSPTTATAALQILADIPRIDAQRGVADVLINPSSALDLRVVAADALVKSIRHFGALLATEQEVQIVKALDVESDPALRAAIDSVIAALRPRPAASARRPAPIQPASIAR